MEKITAAQAQRLTAPSPFALLSSLKEDGSTNLMAVSWWTFLSNRPPMIGVCLGKKGASGKLIQSTGEFALNIVGEELKEAALRCGSCSGRDVNKAEMFSIPLEAASEIAPKIVSGSRVVFECRLTDMKEMNLKQLSSVVRRRVRSNAEHNIQAGQDGISGRLHQGVQK